MISDTQRLVLSTLLLVCVAAYAQDSPGLPSGVSAPRIISRNRALPEYAEEARIARLEGSISLSITVDTDGVPKNITVLRNLGFGLDQKAIEAVGTWRFVPGQKEGKPVPVVVNIEVNFGLPGPKGQWHLAQAAFNPPEGASVPFLIKPQFPPDDPARQSASVAVTFDVDEHGSPINLHIEKSSDPRSEEDVIAAVREWKFKPGVKSGTPVAVPLTLEFSREAAPGSRPSVKVP
jgi:TonB family protein